MTEEDEAFEELAKRQGDWGLQGSRKHQIMRYENDAMRKVQRLGQEIEQEPKEEKLHPIHIGVDVTKEGTAVTAFYRKPDAVMEMFYSQFHPMAQPEQEPVAIKRMKEWIEYLKRKSDHGQHMQIPSEMSAGACWELAIELEQFINTTPPQRTWVGLTDEQVRKCFFLGDAPPSSPPHWWEYRNSDYLKIYAFIEAELKEQNT